MGAISSTTERDVEKILKQNLDFSHRLLQVCDMQGVDLIYASSASVYGDGQNFKEDAPKQPQSPYSWSKYLFDRSIEMISWDDYKCNIKGLRFFNVYGEHEEHKGDQMSVFHKFAKFGANHVAFFFCRILGLRVSGNYRETLGGQNPQNK